MFRHASKNRRFGRVDVVAYPEVAEDLNIDTGGTSKQLPTLALFACGRWGRIGGVGAGTSMLHEGRGGGGAVGFTTNVHNAKPL